MEPLPLSVALLYANTGHVAAWGDAPFLNATFLLSPSPIRRRDANPLPDQGLIHRFRPINYR